MKNSNSWYVYFEFLISLIQHVVFSVMAHMVTLNTYHMHTHTHITPKVAYHTSFGRRQSKRKKDPNLSVCIYEILQKSTKYGKQPKKDDEDDGNGRRNPTGGLFLHLKYPFNQMDLSQTEKAIQEEWKMAACAVDRWLLIIFLLAQQLVMVMAALVIIPNHLLCYKSSGWLSCYKYNHANVVKYNVTPESQGGVPI